MYAVVTRYLADPGPFDAYLARCDAAADAVRHRVEARQGPQGNLRAVLLARKQAVEDAGAPAGQ